MHDVVRSAKSPAEHRYDGRDAGPILGSSPAVHFLRRSRLMDVVADEKRPLALSGMNPPAFWWRMGSAGNT